MQCLPVIPITLLALLLSAAAIAAEPAAPPPAPAPDAETGAPDAVQAPVDPDVAWSLAYKIPENTCEKPRIRQSNEVAGQFERNQRKLERYAACIKEYETGLIADHQRIFQAADKGLTEPQAMQFVETLKSIEKTLEDLGQSVVLERDYTELQRVFSIGNRSSI